MIRVLGWIFVCAVPLLAGVTSPDTPAGRVLAQWLASFNSGNRDRLAAFAGKHDPKMASRLDSMLEFRERTGGFELVQIRKSEALLVLGLLKERSSDSFAEIELRVQGEGETATVSGLRIQLVPAPADLAPSRLTEGALVSGVESYIARNEALSGAMLVTRNGKVVISRAFGLADREKKTANTLDTRFRIGSMNKMFTAVAILQLVEKGKISLNEPVGSYLKDYPNPDIASKVTIRHLLTHTGGTGDIFGPEFKQHRLQLKAIGDYVDLYGKRGPEFEPGTQWRYSNYGFLLLGAIIEAVTRRSYYDVVRENVLKPAGMSHTDSLPEEEKVPELSTGYMNRGGRLIANTDTLPWRGTSAGGGYSTVGDLQKFAEALRKGKLMKPETLAEATRAHKNDYGFGFGVRGGAEGPLFWGHGGGAPGMNGELRVYPESGWVVAVLCNLDPPAATRLADYVSLRMPL